MTKKDYIAIGNELREARALMVASDYDTDGIDKAIDCLVRVFRRDNPAFKEDRFRDFVAGRCGPNGGAR